VGSGGEAKLVIGDGQVLVNGAIETQRRKKIRGCKQICVNRLSSIPLMDKDRRYEQERTRSLRPRSSQGPQN